MTRIAAVAMAVALLSTACSGDDDTTSATTAAPNTTGGTETTSPTTTATTPPTPSTQQDTSTSAPDTSAPPTDTTDASQAADTTEPGSDAVRRAVLDAVVASWQAFNDAKLDPTDDAKVAALDEATGGELLVNSIEVIARYRAENKRSVTNPDVPAAIVVYPDTLEIDLAGGTAQVDYCRIGSNILVEVGANADGSDLVLDDTVNTYVERSLLVLQDGRWLDTGGIELEFLEGATTCPEPD